MLILSRIFLSTRGIINTFGINIFSKKIFLTYQPSLNTFYLDLFVLSLPHIVYIARAPKLNWYLSAQSSPEGPDFSFLALTRVSFKLPT